MASSGERAVEARANGAAGADADSDSEWDFLLTAAPKAHDAQETKRCSHGKCQGRIPISDSHKHCQRCRDYQKRYSASKKGKMNSARYQSSSKGKANIKRHRATQKGKATMMRTAAKYRSTEKGKTYRKQYRNSEEGRAAAKRYDNSKKGQATKMRFRKSEKGRALVKRRNSTPMARLSVSLHGMVRGVHECPVTFPRLGIFSDNSDAREHFQSTFLPWMNWSNQGQRLKDTLPNTVWQIGHRIPRAWYRHEDIGEIKKCWSRANLFAQCAVENIDAADRNILSQAQWLALKAIWPKQCAGMTDEEAWAWCRDNVDNATRRAARAAPKTAGPSDEAGPSDLRTVEDEEASSEDEGPVALDAYDSDTLVFSDDSDGEASSDDEAD